MFRIQQTSGGAEVVVTVEGRLVGEYAAAAESCCDRAFSSGKPVVVLLKNVSPIDADGRALICRLLSRGASILAEGVYTQYLVEDIKHGLNVAPKEARGPR